MRDYRVYNFSASEKLKYFVQALCICAGISYLFYKSVMAMVLIIPLYPVYLRIKAVSLAEERKRLLTEQFSESISFLASALHAGMSVENAWAESCRELTMLYGADSLMACELSYMLGKIDMNESVEDALMDFALRSDIEDVFGFCTVFSFAKRSGGNFLGIIKQCSDRISRKTELIRELNADLASRKLECKVMNAVPAFILMYLSVTSPGYFDGLYHNPAGVAVMSLCLAAYIAAYAMSENMLAQALKYE